MKSCIKYTGFYIVLKLIAAVVLGLLYLSGFLFVACLSKFSI